MVSEQLIMDVSKGNFGALKIIKDMMYYAKWWDMMKLLEKRSIVGEKLYLKVTDEFNGDFMKFGDYLKGELQNGKK